MGAVNRIPVPFFRKLLLENKILIFFAILLLLVGAVSLYAQHLVTGHLAGELVRDRLRATLAPSLDGLGEAVAEGDSLALVTRLAEAARRDPWILQLSVGNLSVGNVAVAGGLGGSVGRADSLGHDGDAVVGDDAVADDGTENVRGPGYTARERFETTLPLVSRGERQGTLRVAVDRRHIARYADLAVLMVLGITVIPVTLLFLAARAIVRQAVEPLKKLTHVADAISAGNLDPIIDFGVHVNCWEIKGCQRADCRAYMNLDQQCWYIDGTPCEGYESRFPQKLQGCRTCDVYQAHRGDEIVQLADAFRHMTGVLKESREDLVKAGDFQRRLIRNSFNGIVAADADDNITIFNRVAEDLLGVDRTQVIGIRHWRHYFRDDLDMAMDLPLSFERVRRVRGFPPREALIRREDGELVDVLLSGISLFERGRHIGKVFFFQDIREIKQLRGDLIRSERLAATGQTAAGISHSIKNILDGFRGGAYVFKAGKRRGDQRKMEQGWDMIERNTEIISNLVGDLLNFAKARMPEYEEVDPAALLANIVASAGLETQDRIQIRTEVDPASGHVVLDPHAFEQCLANLLHNAVEAIPDDRPGQVTMRFSTEGDRAVFTVRDDGSGMSASILEKVKGGMFSTKGSKGTGLGLLVTQKIVDEHRGTMMIESAENEGTTFRIEIPASGAPPATASGPAAASGTPPATATGPATASGDGRT